MLSRALLALYFCVISSNLCLAAEWSWAAPNDGKGLTLVTNGDAYPASTVDNKPVIGPPPNPDFMNRRGVAFRVDDTAAAATETLFVLIEHLDVNIGSIQVTYDSALPPDNEVAGNNPHAAAAGAVAGHMALGSSTPKLAIFSIRSAAFQHRQPGGADFEVQGVSSIAKVTLTTEISEEQRTRALAAREKRGPKRVNLQRPMQLVVGAGGDAATPDGLAGSQEAMRYQCPVFEMLGFTAVESYVKWNFVEPERGKWDWSFYDGVVETAGEFGLKWFPLLIVGSAYSLPDWYFNSPENTGFVCLEHGIRNNVQTIYNENQTPYVQRFMKEFGAHYGSKDALLGVRLGPSGNYGESQYPASGSPMGYKGEKQHVHLGWWAADAWAPIHFQNYLKKQYPSVKELNDAWSQEYVAFDEVKTFHPDMAETPRMRKDFVDWYVFAMTDWCERWAVWAREALPGKSVYQSAGGWGFLESGTDFAQQAKSMVGVKGGIRATNETDSYAQNFYVTRMMSSAARFYKVPFGSEPAGFGSARGVISRLYNIIVNDGEHLFYYGGNFLSNDQAIDKWIQYAPLLDKRAKPVIDVAVLYPDTKSKLDDGVFRNLYSSSFYPRVVTLRPELDYDFCGEQMVLDGALPQYKVLCMVWNSSIEGDVLNKIDEWVQAGGTVIHPYCWPRYPLGTVEGDFTVYNKWRRGETGKGRVIWFNGNHEPPSQYTTFIKEQLLAMEGLNPLTQRMLRVEKPDDVYVSALETGELAFLNYAEHTVTVQVPDTGEVKLEPISITLTK